MNQLKTDKRSVLLGALSLVISSTCVNAAQSSKESVFAKHTMVAPQDMTQQKLQSPDKIGVLSHSTMLPVTLSESVSSQNGSLNLRGQTKSASASFSERILFDGDADSPILLIGPNTDKWQLQVLDANQQNISVKSPQANNQASHGMVNIGGQEFAGKQFIVGSPSVGEWTVKINANSQKQTNQAKAKGAPDAYLVFKGDPNYKLYSYRDNNFTTQNSQINVVAYMVDSKNLIGQRSLITNQRPLNSDLNRLVVKVTSPSGKQSKIKLNDRGLHGDKLAGDGKFSVALPTDEVGVYSSQLYAEGVRPDGIKFSRTVNDLYVVEEISHQVIGSKGLMVTGENNTVEVKIPVQQLTAEKRVFASGEVYATDSNGKLQPAAWIGGITTTQSESSLNSDYLSLSFDSRWLSRKKLSAPISVRNLRLQSVNTNVPLLQVDSLNLIADTKTLSLLNSVQQSRFIKAVASDSRDDISKDMLMGKAPQASFNAIKSSANPKLLLVHGYCSGGAWNTGEFSNSAEFKDYKKNRSHDEFANLILNFGSAYTSYGIVGHSQGGAAALHLYSRYWSGLDYASGGRIIQSVGTPYQGTALAGNLAAIGDVFGAGCGTNTDLTYSGASNWLSTIPSWARAQVDYYTTSFNTRWWAYDYCHLGTDLFLDDPEDGTTEKWAGQLSGAVNKGHKKGWCHTTGMRDPAQTRDGSRNSSMNSRAAR